MPERIVAILTGDLPEPILIIPFETWKTFELTGEKKEFITVEFIKIWNCSKEILFPIEREAKCQTKKYTNLLGGMGTGIIVPKEITQRFGIRMNQYLEVILKKIIKDDQEIDIFPEREVFEHYPTELESQIKRESS